LREKWQQVQREIMVLGLTYPVSDRATPPNFHAFATIYLNNTIRYQNITTILGWALSIVIFLYYPKLSDSWVIFERPQNPDNLLSTQGWLTGSSSTL
jgi:hypothetical protein